MHFLMYAWMMCCIVLFFQFIHHFHQLFRTFLFKVAHIYHFSFIVILVQSCSFSITEVKLTSDHTFEKINCQLKICKTNVIRNWIYIHFFYLLFVVSVHVCAHAWYWYHISEWMWALIDLTFSSQLNFECDHWSAK